MQPGVFVLEIFVEKLMGPELALPGVDDVHVWMGHPADAYLPYSDFAAVLSPDESRRAARLRSPSDREVFVTTHGLLRMLLGRYLRWPPEAIAIHVSATGKPELAPASGFPDLRFSLSHTRNGLMLGFARNKPVGVDIENVEREVEIESLQERVLRAEEIERLDGLAVEDRKTQFFRYWTYKEAYLKATGIGLGRDMRHFRFVPTGTPALQSVIEDDNADSNGGTWTVSEVSARQGLVAAVAVACSAPKIVRRSIGEVL